MIRHSRRHYSGPSIKMEAYSDTRNFFEKADSKTPLAIPRHR
jgi:hypothetical protein